MGGYTRDGNQSDLPALFGFAVALSLAGLLGLALRPPHRLEVILAVHLRGLGLRLLHPTALALLLRLHLRRRSR
eukprot:497862-Prorocentrum_minimum.AAC.1